MGLSLHTVRCRVPSQGLPSVPRTQPALWRKALPCPAMSARSAALLVLMVVDIYEGHAGFLGEFFTAQDLLEQGLLEGLSCVAPQPVLTSCLGHHDTAQRVLGWGSVRHGDRWSVPILPLEAG